MPADAPPPALVDGVRESLKGWDRSTSESTALADLGVVAAHVGAGATPREATNRVLLAGLDALAETHPGDARLLRQRYLDRQPVHVVANRLNIAESTVYPRQREAIQRLAAEIQKMELERHDDRRARLERRLPPATTARPVAIEARLEPPLAALDAPDAPWIVALTGQGGIGKTTLARVVAGRRLEEGPFTEIGWVSAQSAALSLGGAIRPLESPALTVDALIENLAEQLLGDSYLAEAGSRNRALAALTSELSRQPHLIVIDNLETIADMERLLPTLRTLIQPTKFLLTTRYSLFSEPDVFHLVVPELDRSDAMLLVRQEAGQRNLPELATASDEALGPIYETVGGNPLALRLVVGQAHIHSLPGVLDDLRAARGTTVDHLYRYLYQQIWNSLNETTRLVLLAMPLVAPAGADPSFLQEITELDIADVRQALTVLVTLNVVDVRGTLYERRYAIHNLTRSFLEEQVAKWR